MQSLGTFRCTFPKKMLQFSPAFWSDISSSKACLGQRQERHLSNAPFRQNVYPSARPSKRGTLDPPACLPARPSVRPAILLPVVRHSPPLVRTIRGYPGSLSGVFHGYIMGVSYGYPMALSGLILGYPMGILGYPRVSYGIWLNQHFGSTIQS